MAADAKLEKSKGPLLHRIFPGLKPLTTVDGIVIDVSRNGTTSFSPENLQKVLESYLDAQKKQATGNRVPLSPLGLR